jgi:hypothetical protein
MHKTAFAIVIALAANAAHAFSAGNEAKKLELCRMVGNEAEIGYQNRGTPLPSNIDDETRQSWIGGIMQFAYNYGHETRQQTGVRRTWSHSASASTTWTTRRTGVPAAT